MPLLTAVQITLSNLDRSVFRLGPGGRLLRSRWPLCRTKRGCRASQRGRPGVLWLEALSSTSRCVATRALIADICEWIDTARNLRPHMGTKTADQILTRSTAIANE